MTNKLNNKDFIKVEDYITPKRNDGLFYVIHAFWFKKDKKGILFVEELDPKSWFKPARQLNIMEFKDINDLQKEHLKLCIKLDWRKYKNAPTNDD